MTVTALTSKEKETLRLLLRGHDAKSSARELGLSVHTVNERLRDARRKLGVTSSRAAARELLAEEGDHGGQATPQTLQDKHLGGGAAGRVGAESGSAATGRRAWHGPGPRFALTLTGVFAMSLVLAALLLPASPLSVLPADFAGGAETATESAEMTPAGAAEQFLVLLEQGRWADSYAMTSAEFRRLNTLEVWTEVSQRVRRPLGEAQTREIIGDEFVPAPPAGYQMVKFRTRYVSGADQTETLSLVREQGAWKVAGIVID